MYLEVKGISKYFGKTCVLNNINLKMETGHIYGFWGRNGSGKTMLMRIISGLVFPSDGAIIIGGEQLGKDISFPRSIGALIENPGFIPGYSGFKNLKNIGFDTEQNFRCRYSRGYAAYGIRSG